MLLKILGLSLWGYLIDPLNIFDAILVIFSIVEIISEFADPSGGNGMNLTVFRGIRILRLLKIIRSWGNLREILICLGATTIAAIDFVFLFLLFIFI
jgi:hypothetical protein